MLYKEKQNPELYQLKHMHDKELHRGFDYENNSIMKSATPVVLRNKTMNDFLNRIQKLIAIWFDEANLLRNFFNYRVDKNYDRHPN